MSPHCLLLTSHSQLRLVTRRTPLWAHALVSLTLLLALSAPSAEGAPPTTTLVSINSAGTGGGNGDSFAPSISKNGKVVAFQSGASNLVTNDTNGGVSDVFVRDLGTGVTTLVSVNSAGTGSGIHSSGVPLISANGKFVAFQSFANDLVTGDTNGLQDVFLRDLKNGVTQMVSVNAAGAPTTTGGGSFVLGVSANGQFVAFHSTATDLVAGVTDTNGSSDIFVRDMKNGVTHLVTVTNTGANTPTFGSFFQMMSENGHKVVFTNTKTTEMVTGFTDGNGESCCTAPDLFVRDIMKGTTTLVNVNLAGTGSGNGGVGQGEGISPNGRFVVFSSNANNLIAVDPPHFIDATNIYIRDLIKGTTKIVTVNVSGDNRVGGNNGSFFPRVSNNGQFVLFSSSATNLTGLPKPNLTYVYLRDMNEAAQEPVSINSAGTAMGNSSAATLIPALLSNNGKFVVFNSFASDLVTNDTNGHSDLFVRNMNAGATSLVSINSAGTDSGGGAVFPFTPSSPHVLSSNGRVVAFDSRANDLVTNDGNTFIDVFVRNLQ